MISLNFEFEIDLGSDVVNRIVGFSLSSLSAESLTEINLLEFCSENLSSLKYGRKRVRVERDDYVSWENILF